MRVRRSVCRVPRGGGGGGPGPIPEGVAEAQGAGGRAGRGNLPLHSGPEPRDQLPAARSPGGGVEGHYRAHRRLTPQRGRPARACRPAGRDRATPRPLPPDLHAQSPARHDVRRNRALPRPVGQDRRGPDGAGAQGAAELRPARLNRLVRVSRLPRCLSHRMPHDRDIDWTLLTRYVAGECSQAESADVERWLDADPARQEQLAAARRLWDQAAALPPATRIDAMWQDLRRRMREGDQGAQPAQPVRAWHIPWRLAAAACLAVVIGGVAIRAARTPRLPEPQVFASAARQRLNVRLGDGTRVLLAPESRLRLATDFGRQRRDVYVEGEAYFEVQHDSPRPFTVFAANSSTRDIGTAFAVRSYPQDRAVRVVVREGQVALSGAGLLAAGGGGRVPGGGPRACLRRATSDASRRRARPPYGTTPTSQRSSAGPKATSYSKTRRSDRCSTTYGVGMASRRNWTRRCARCPYQR